MISDISLIQALMAQAEFNLEAMGAIVKIAEATSSEDKPEIKEAVEQLQKTNGEFLERMRSLIEIARQGATNGS